MAIYVAITYIVVMPNLERHISELKPRERLIKKGVSSLSDGELISLLLRTGGHDQSVGELATSLLLEHKSLYNLLQLDYDQLKNKKYIGATKACTIVAAAELAKRYYTDLEMIPIKIKSAQDAFKLVKYDLIGKKKEYLYLISLSVKNTVIAKDLIYIGSINEISVSIKEIIIKALHKCASGIILVHNHPSKDTTPSPEDIALTNKLMDIANYVGLTLVDHLITADFEYTSMKAQKVVNFKQKGGEHNE